MDIEFVKTRQKPKLVAIEAAEIVEAVVEEIEAEIPASTASSLRNQPLWIGTLVSSGKREVRHDYFVFPFGDCIYPPKAEIVGPDYFLNKLDNLFTAKYIKDLRAPWLSYYNICLVRHSRGWRWNGGHMEVNDLITDIRRQIQNQFRNYYNGRPNDKWASIELADAPNMTAPATKVPLTEYIQELIGDVKKAQRSRSGAKIAAAYKALDEFLIAADLVRAAKNTMEDWLQI